MFKLKVEKEFLEDLNNISEYIYRETYSLEITQTLSDEIIKSILILQLFPFMYSKKYKEFRCINIKSYQIFYIVNELNKEVNIYRIFWESQDFKGYI